MYAVRASADDDDGGSGSDGATVLITGAPSLSRGAGYWQKQYSRVGVLPFTDEQLLCYLEITAHLSTVFGERRDAATIRAAHDDIFVAGLNGDMSEQLDRQLLTAWVNFANGGVEYAEQLDTDGNRILDTPFSTVMARAEQVRTDPASSRQQLQQQRDVLRRVNERDGL